MKKHIVYIGIENIKDAYEDIETLPVIRVGKMGMRTEITEGIKEVEEAIIRIVPYLERGEEYSGLTPFAVEIGEETVSRRRKRRRGQGGAL